MRILFVLLFSIQANAYFNANEVGQSVSKKDIDVKIAKKWFDHYYAKGSEDFQSAFERGDQYKKSIELVLKRYQVPVDFYYLAMTESYFNNHARSHKEAVGLWQFIPSTAENYGLIVSEQIDERRHPIKSTIAAAKYLRDLHNIFQDWTLAAAAYNCGEYRVLRAIKKGGTRSFAKLAEMKLLPDETINYVSKFWVTREIDAKIRKKSSMVSMDRYLDSGTITIKSLGTKLETLSLISELSVDEIISYNPGITKKMSSFPINFNLYLPRVNANLYSSFIRQNGVVSKVTKPEALHLWGIKDSVKGDDIKITFISPQQIKIKNMRTKEETIINKRELSKI